MANAAITFFNPRTSRIESGGIENFLGGFEERELARYVQSGLEDDRSRVADDALALHCLGMLGEARFDYIGALRALEALKTSARLRDRKGARLISADLIRNIADRTVELPPWTFEIEVCHTSTPGDWLIETPLERRMGQVQRIAERQQAKEGEDGEDPCDCTPDEPACEPQDPCCGKVNYYVADLLELRDWLYRYKAAEIADITVTAAGETHSREHEMKRTRDLFSETETTERTAETRDLQVADRSAFKREIDRQQEQSASGDATVTGKYDAKAYSLTATVSASFSRSSSEAIREAQEQSVETVKKAVSEIEKQVRVRTSERLTTEETEKNFHEVKNATGDPLVTQYFWVTQERRAQLYSYGTRMLAEFIVPEPARLYEYLMKLRREAEIEKRVHPPRGVEPTPPKFGLQPQDLNDANYKQLCEEWGVKNPPAWPPPTMQISDSEIDDWDRDGTNIPLDTLHFSIPAGYEAIGMDLAVPRADFMDENPRKIEFTGPDTMYIVEGGTWKDHVAFAPHITGYHEIAIAASHTTHVHVIVSMNLIRQPGVLELWQKTVFNLLLAQYEQALAAYEEKMKPWDAYHAAWEELERELIETERSRNPFYNREIERAELKRAVIYLMCQDFSCDGAMIRKAEPCGFPEIHRTKAAKKGYDWYFWERLIDWKQMAYAFFDYFWNPICDWPQRFDPDEPDAMFKAFLRAGFGRVIVPVSSGMEADFVWYVNTHQKWGQNSMPPTDPSDPRWRNVVFEMGHANAAAMVAREGRVEVDPTTNVIVLKGSDRYWDEGPTPTLGVGNVDPAAIGDDVDREIFIEGETYLITAIVASADPNAPGYDPSHPNSMWWDVTLDRNYAGPAGSRLYAMGAKAVAPVFSFDLPTELIWAGAHNKCLPTYPLPACVE